MNTTSSKFIHSTLLMFAQHCEGYLAIDTGGCSVCAVIVACLNASQNVRNGDGVE